MKAEHYIKSGLNGLPTSVMRLADCVAMATGQVSISYDQPDLKPAAAPKKPSIVNRQSSIPSVSLPVNPSFQGSGLPSQGDFTLIGEAFVTDAPITFLGFVNRDTGVIEEEGHPADGQSMAGKIAVFPKGSGSTVAPYVLLELYYKAVAPLAIVNTELDQQSAPACSLEGIPYAYGFSPELLQTIRSGDWVELKRQGEQVSIRRLED